MKLTKILQGENIDATVYYKSVDVVEASEGAYVGSSDTFKSTAFEVNAKEGSTIKLNFEVQKLKSKAASGGILDLTGSADNHAATVTSGGILKAKSLETKQTTVGITAGGEADVYASDFVDAKTTAGGTIDVLGSPKQVNQKTAAGGKINVVK